MYNFANSVMANMHFAYGIANRNAKEAKRFNVEKYPNAIIRDR